MALYPPIVASSMPAFDISQGVKVYFTVPLYNNINDIQQVHISVRRQDNNTNMLVSTAETMGKNIGEQTLLDKLLNRYYITINNNNIKGGFKLNVIYKVQLRFSSIHSDDYKSIYNINGEDKYSGLTFAKFVEDHLDSFSLWSTVCLIKPISPPEFYLQDFFYINRNRLEQLTTKYYYTASIADFIGIYKANQSSLVLKSWRLRLLSPDYTRKDLLNIDNYTLADSGVNTINFYNYTDNSNSVVFEANLPYLFTNIDSDGNDLSPEEKQFKLFLEILTKNGYRDNILYFFLYKKIWSPTIEGGSFIPTINEELGYIKLEFSTGIENLSNYVIRRSDAKDGFKKWEDLKNFVWKKDSGVYTYYDFTAESGTFYKYLIQRRTIRGRRGTPLFTNPIMGLWLHAFLLLTSGQENISNTKQLKLAYDFQISSYKQNIGLSRTDTIGSQYPFIRRNGNMNYKSFSITGTITLAMDNVELFTTNLSILDNQVSLYNNHKYGITYGDNNYYILANRYDYTYERNFRLQVLLFLNNAKPKLYKSMQEGNLLVKLMEVSFTPKNELGRLIYTFSATAYEIGTSDIHNLENQGILNVGYYNTTLSEEGEPTFKHFSSYSIVSDSSPNIDNTDTFIANPFANVYKGGLDIISNVSTPAAGSIAEFLIKQQQEYNKEQSGDLLDGTVRKIDSFKIHYLKLEIYSDPYMIRQTTGSAKSLSVVSNQSKVSGLSKKKFYRAHSVFPFGREENNLDTNYYLGHLFTINGLQVIIAPPNNIYELKELDVEITSIIPAYDTAMSIDVVYSVNSSIDAAKEELMRNYITTNGQVIDTFEKIDLLYYTLAKKYNTKVKYGRNIVEQNLVGIQTINIDTEPNTVIKLKTSASNQSEYMIVNQTGLLFFDPNEEDVYITEFQVIGMFIPKSKVKNKTGTIEELESQAIDFDKASDNYDNDYIYYNYQWRKIIRDEIDLTGNDLEIGYFISYPITSMLNYSAILSESGYEDEEVGN